LFFLILGATESYEKFKELRTGKIENGKSINDQFDDATTKLDSVDIKKNIEKALKNVDSTDRAEILKALPIITPDSLKNKPKNSTNINVSFFPDAKKYFDFQKKYPDIEIESGLDSLKVAHTFMNRFMYSRFQAVRKIIQSNDNKKEFVNQLISSISISLFILLPLFTLFLKFFYMRRKFTYVEHLIFVFHTQTVFFLLLTIFYLLNYFNNQDYIIPVFLLLFLIYLYLAMKRFYSQGHLKTFIKFLFINFSFAIISTIGFAFVALIAFVLY